MIRRLPEDVVNRMAAGEVLVRPMNAVKEMIENSLDADATEISVVVRNGGVEFLQISDNGKGIERDDFELVCQRFATSKLRDFDDLMDMKTFGFRGEALASLSLVSKVNIVSKTAHQQTATSANYLDGKVEGKLKSSAGSKGTTITATDLFYNLPSRKSSIMNNHDEKKRIRDLMVRFAIHRPEVAFSLRQNQSSDFRTKGDGNVKNIVSLLLGKDISENLIIMELDSRRLKYKLTGAIAKPSAMASANGIQDVRSRRKFFSVFINGRCVECTDLQNSIEMLLSESRFYTKCVFIDLEIERNRIDVNVHPTKKSVIFLDQDDIFEEITKHIEGLLDGMLEVTTSSMPSEDLDVSTCSSMALNTSIASVESNRSERSFSFPDPVMIKKKPSYSTSVKEKKRNDYMEVRTDHRERSMHEFVVRRQESESTSSDIVNASFLSASSNISDTTLEEDQLLETTAKEEIKTNTYRKVELTSVNNLRHQICSQGVSTLSEFFKGIILVGCLDMETVLVQYGVSLYKMNLRAVLEELFYQMIIFTFGNLGSLKFDQDQVVSVAELLEIASEDEEFAVFSCPEKRLEAEKLLAEHGEMLDDLFAITLEYRKMADDQQRLCLIGVPFITDSFTPQLEQLPRFVSQLLTRIDFDVEEKCFESLARVVATFFTPQTEFTEEDCISAFCATSWKRLVRGYFIPTIKKKLIPVPTMKPNDILQELANCHDLYKVFERCSAA